MYIPVVCYHSVSDQELPYSIDVNHFTQQIFYLRKRYTLISLDDLYRILTKQLVVKNPAVVTFDDGYRDNFLNAFPVMLDLNVPFAVFIATHFIGGKKPLNGIPLEMLSWNEIQEMHNSGLASFQSHTHTHARLVGLDREDVKREMAISQTIIQQHLGIKPRFFAFPKGRSDEISKSTAKDFFDMAFSKEGLIDSENSDLYALERVMIRRTMDSVRFKMALTSAYWRIRGVVKWPK